MFEQKWRAGLTRSLFAVATAAVLVVGAGCGGGGDDDDDDDDQVAAPATALVGLQANGTTLVSFNASNAGTVTATRNITGLREGESIVAIDSRVAPIGGDGGNGVVGVYGISNQARVYVLNSSGAATAVNPTPFSYNTAPPSFSANTGLGFDFNPAPDRIRLEAGVFNARVNPNNGNAVDGNANQEGTQQDVNLAYASGDRNAGRTPNVVASAYVNNDRDAGTTTTNYAIDANRDVLVTQGGNPANGTPGDPGNPNLGQLFTVGDLGVNVGNAASLEIVGASNTAFLTTGSGSSTRLYLVNLATGRATRVTNGQIGGGQGIIGIAAATQGF